MVTFRQAIGAAVGAAIIVGGLAASTAGARATPVSPVPSATVAASSHRAGARPVALTLRIRYEMQCGWPGAGPLTIRLPDAMVVPTALARSAVLLDGKPAASVGHRGHRIVLGLPPRPQILCDVIGPGALTIVFTRRARFGNPSIAGIYRLRVTKGSLAFDARLTIQPR